MLNSVMRYSAVAALGLAALAQPTLAHEHHHYANHVSAHRHYLVAAAERREAAPAATLPQAIANFVARLLGPPDRGAERGKGRRADRSTDRRADRSTDRRADRGTDRGADRGTDRGAGQASAYAAMVEAQARANGVPASLVHRVIMRESGYNPRAVSSGNYGLMQIRLGTARAMGYGGSAAGLLDPATNLTYAVRYLAGAYRTAGGNESRAAELYRTGYYGEAKAQGSSPYRPAR